MSDDDHDAPALARPETHPERRTRRQIRLPERARRVLSAVAEVVAPERRRFDFDPPAWVVLFIESYLAYMPVALRTLFPWGLLALEWAAVPIGGGRRFSRLDRAARLRYIERIQRWRALAPLADVWLAVRGLAACAFYSHPDVAAHIGYAHQPWIDLKVRERRERFGAPEPW